MLALSQLPDFDSATRTPAKNAPAAAEMPSWFAMKDKPNATPKIATMSTSTWFVLLTRSTILGTVFEPINKAPPMNARTNTTDMAISWIVRVPLEATDCNTASVETMIISSITVTPKRRVETSLFAMPNSCKTRDNTTVLVTEIARAMKRLSNKDNPIIWPTANPSPKVPN